MNRKHFEKCIDRQFQNLTMLSDYYWHYKRELETFSFITELSYECGLISNEAYKSTLNFCNEELARYGKSKKDN